MEILELYIEYFNLKSYYCLISDTVINLVITGNTAIRVPLRFQFVVHIYVHKQCDSLSRRFEA